MGAANGDELQLGQRHQQNALLACHRHSTVSPPPRKSPRAITYNAFVLAAKHVDVNLPEEATELKSCTDLIQEVNGIFFYKYILSFFFFFRIILVFDLI